MLVYLPIYIAAILEGEIYYISVCSLAIIARSVSSEAIQVWFCETFWIASPDLSSGEPSRSDGS